MTPPEIHSDGAHYRRPAQLRQVSEDLTLVVTERGIAINPRREDLIHAKRTSTLPIRPSREIQKEVFDICGGAPQKPKLTDRPVAIVKWVDGTVLDTVWQVG